MGVSIPFAPNRFLYNRGSMPLAVGTRVRTYEIVALIGQGGMGEVYRARDTTLRRDVALKILPPLVAADADRRARFTREAHVLATLSHPHIASILGMEEADGITAIVLELVEGLTLAERLAGGALPLTEALTIAVQIAAALEAAHEKGVVHRDLKPANIKLAADGSVKVLDFGLAKALIDESAPSATISPTLTAMASRLGIIVGTAAYMSPEQAKGQTVDKRMDIWAFGCVLYDMLTGRRAFRGDDVTDVIVAIMTGEPDWTALPPATPPRVIELLHRCLQKDVRARWRDIGDARIQLEEALREPVSALRRAPTEGRRRMFGFLSVRAIALAVSGALVGALIATAWKPVSPVSGGSPARFEVPLPSDASLGAIDFPAVAISPDASLLAYVGMRGGHTQLFVRPMNGTDATPLPGTNNAANPVFSPDSHWIAFFADGQLKKVLAAGAAPITLCEAPVGVGASWGADDTIIFAGATGSGLSQVPAAGGRPRAVTSLDRQRGEFSHRWPDLLPDGKTVLYTVGTVGSWDDAQIVAQSLTTGKRSLLVQGGTNPHYLRSGHLIYARAGALMAVGFDATTLSLIGSPVRVLDNVLQSFDGAAQISVSATGSAVYAAGTFSSDQRRLVAVDRTGSVTPFAAPLRQYGYPQLSPDGRHVLVTIDRSTPDLWLYDIAAATLRQLTFDAGATFPIWTPDGQRAVFSSNASGVRNLFWMPVFEPGQAERLATSEYVQLPGSWSPDAGTLAFVERHPTTGRDIWVLPFASDRIPRPFLHAAFDEGAPRFSPDGRWLAYVSNESGRTEVFLRSRVDLGQRQPVSTNGGAEPVWARDGRQLFYRHDDKMMVVAILSNTASPRVGPPQEVFAGNFAVGTLDAANYDVMPDGQRFLMVQAEQPSSQRTLQVLINWLGVVAAAAPSGR
jgi:serine/threonine protein kinase/Tol biopolymer transport system component